MNNMVLPHLTLESTEQWGFRNLHSTVLALLNSSNNWYINIDKGDTNGVILLDIKKAFYTIDHSILFEKLSHYGVSEDSLFFFIKSYLMNKIQCCSVNGKLSSIKQIKAVTSCSTHKIDQQETDG